MDITELISESSEVTNLSPENSDLKKGANVHLLFHRETGILLTRKNVAICNWSQQTNRMNLRFPSIIQLYHIEKIDNELDFFQEFFPYGDLTKFEEYNYIGENIIAQFFYQCARGLQYLHNQGYIHRDIKPPNIFIDKNKNASLEDLENSTNDPDSQSAYGNGTYAAPEIYKEGQNTKKSDIYSIGATFEEYILKIQGDDDFKNDLLDIVSQTKAEEPDNRISADDLVSQLEELLKKNEMDSIINEFESRIEPCKNSYTFYRLDDIDGVEYEDNKYIEEIVNLVKN
ncbi:CAMK family protein kinase [Trichomonas vaginalis G3]|uniref:non-specific serine/threonine protein kinase n=1 Tax=Trichomonas vaginalis (strain ATCC PRA-98 / G3) TaxID=412133 RepID=A2EV60_TRIV3|nr:MAP kinase kinase kinase protein [Trichomonas vaginalis G3]EAY03443.1 CAMK family protein kinase [Trichomonas vaginalis G3]KAI5486177.1 MAP kinase kinase kinase protein [Trichomonas vaginalis G3]|eukprot:XP_001315666.1 CAMK family protein kinase [Trichomonas vaginalis G3]